MGDIAQQDPVPKFNLSLLKEVAFLHNHLDGIVIEM